MMIEKIMNFENRFPEIFSNVLRIKHAYIYYNVNNPLSWDSNHAIITKEIEVDKTVDDIIEFFNEINIKPRIYTLSQGESPIGRYLENRGFMSLTEKMSFFYQTKAIKTAGESTIEIKRITEVDETIENLIYSDEEEGEWTIKTLKESIGNGNFYLFGGFADKKIAVIASLHKIDEISRIDHVFTRKEMRNKGYCSQIMKYITEYNENELKTKIYLYSNNPKAISIYKKAGYEEIKNIESGNYWLE